MLSTLRKSQLQDIRETLMLATDLDDIVRANLQLVTWLEDLPRDIPEEELLRELVREAHELLTNPQTQLDLRDWKRAAAPFLAR